MIEFMGTMPDWQLTVVGDTRPPSGMEYYVNCRDAIQTRGITNVELTPKVTREELSKIFDAHSVIISSSLEEGTHCVIAEGMLAGMYPLVRHWDGATEMYPPECVFDNFEQLKKMLNEYADIPVEEKRQGSMHYRLWVEKRYDYETQARKVVDVIEKAARDGPQEPWWKQ
jgi:glycosyltransferase involved in cell wall biosynthesis